MLSIIPPLPQVIFPTHIFASSQASRNELCKLRTFAMRLWFATHMHCAGISDTKWNSQVLYSQYEIFVTNVFFEKTRVLSQVRCKRLHPSLATVSSPAFINFRRLRSHVLAQENNTMAPAKPKTRTALVQRPNYLTQLPTNKRHAKIFLILTC